MIHRRKGRKLKRTAAHRRATLSNLAVSLIKYKKIKTTVAKAKELRGYIDSLITKSRKALSTKENGSAYGIHLRRQVNSYLKDKTAVKTLFDEIAVKTGDRQGGYTRVLKMGRRYGDSAELALIELVDYNLEQAEQKTKEKPASSETKPVSKKRTRRKSTAEKPAKKKKKKEAEESSE